MAILTEAAAPPLTSELTYEAYMAEPDTEGRYSIINGVRKFMAGASYRHQRVSKNISQFFDRYEETSGLGVTLYAPFDVLIRRFPKLQTRQPDVLFISLARMASGGGIPVKGPFNAAPELVVEIISDSETQRVLEDKLTDYLSIGVDECWVVRPDTQTVEVLRLTTGTALSAAVYDAAQTVVSEVFPSLTVAVTDIFAS